MELLIESASLSCLPLPPFSSPFLTSCSVRWTLLEISVGERGAGKEDGEGS